MSSLSRGPSRTSGDAVRVEGQLVTWAQLELDRSKTWLRQAEHRSVQAGSLDSPIAANEDRLGVAAETKPRSTDVLAG